MQIARPWALAVLALVAVAAIVAGSYHRHHFGSLPAAIVWSESQRSLLQSLSLASLRPHASVSNRVADDPLAQTLGRQLFFDTALSANGDVSCASCHQPDKHFTDGLPVAASHTPTARNTPTLTGAFRQHWFYWDGRRDSLWSQALTPFEAPAEMGVDRYSVVQHVLQNTEYRQQYERLFGSVSNATTLLSYPQPASPLGSDTAKTNWRQIPPNHRKRINRAYSNIGKVIAAFERTLDYTDTRFDRYVGSVVNNESTTGLIDAEELAGMRLFMDAERTQCLQCHNSPLFSNRSFKNIGSGRFSGSALDFGRLFGIQAVLLDEFNCNGHFSDARPDDCSQLRFMNKKSHVPMKGAFKVPSLRHLSATAPYFHDGRFNTLEEVLAFYNAPSTDNGPHELQPLDLNRKELRQLEAFLRMLD